MGCKMNFTARLEQLHGVVCESIDAVEYEEPSTDPVYAVGTALRFADGTRVEAQFWRLIKGREPLVSIFDHGQRYGLPAPVDAIGVLRGELGGRRIARAAMDEATGDLHLHFDEDLVLQVFNFTAYEIWSVAFSDGTGELSNYALANHSSAG